MMSQRLHMLVLRLKAWANSLLFGLLSLVILELKFLWGTWRSWDLPLWDGSTYFIYAQRVVEHFRFPVFEWSPSFAGYYAVFHLLFSDASPFMIYYVHRIFTIFAFLVLTYVLLRLHFLPAVAWLLSALVIVLPVVYTNHFVVHLFTSLALLCAYLASLMKSNWSASLTLVSLGVAALVRLEFMLTFFLAAAFFIFRDHHLNKRGGGRTFQLLYYAPLLGFVILLLVMSVRKSPSHTPIDRLWGAFMQHYAIGYQERHPGWDVNPWFKYDEAIAKSFGDAGSLVEATFHNPSALLMHVWWNVKLIPNALSTMLFIPFVSRLLWMLCMLFGLGLFVIGVYCSVQHLWRVYSHEKMIHYTGRRKFWVVLICSLPPFFVPALLIRPRAIYFISILPAILIFVGTGFEKLLSKLHIIDDTGVFLPILFSVFFLILPTPFAKATNRPVIDTVHILSDLPIEGEFGLLSVSARGLCAYSGQPGCRGVEIIQVPDVETPFEKYLSEQDIRVILVNNMLFNNLAPAGQAFITDLRRVPGDLGWKLFKRVGDFEIYLYTDD